MMRNAYSAGPRAGTPAAQKAFGPAGAGGMARLYSGGIWNSAGCGSAAGAALHAQVTWPNALVTLVSTGSPSLVLVHTSAVVGICAGFGFCGICGIPDTPGACGIFICGTCGGAGGGMMYRLPSASCPAISFLPNSSTPIAGAAEVADGDAAAPAGSAPGRGGCSGRRRASFLRWSRMMACCTAGSVITEISPASIRIFPSPARTMRESDWLEAPLCPDCAVV